MIANDQELRTTLERISWFHNQAALLALLYGLGIALSASAGFITAPTYPVGISPVSLAVGDFNGDGIPDLAVANAGDHPANGTVTILLGRGDGTFQSGQIYAAGEFPTSLAVGDFNGDGVPDLAVADRGDYPNNGTVSVLLGRGDGTFQTGQAFTAGQSCSSVAVGDSNGDGVLDLVVTNRLIEGGQVTVLLGKGDGTFEAAQSYPAGRSAQAVAVGDFNGDGIPDLAVANFEPTASYIGTVSVLLGNGNGSFNAPHRYAVGLDPTAVAVGDFNGDGVLDLAVATSEAESGTVVIWVGRGDGTFQFAGSLPAGAGPVGVSLGDFNGDGKQDIVVTNYYQGNPPRNPGPRISGVRVYLGNGDGTFQGALVYKSDLGTKAVTVADFNGDGVPDLAIANYGWFADAGNTVSILFGKGDGTLQTGQSYEVGYSPTSVVAGDFNGDGRLDLAVAAGVSVCILLSNGDGTFQAAQSYSSPGATFLAVGDFNGDGNLDLAVANGYDANTVSVLLGNGDGTFQMRRTYGVGTVPLCVTVADFNRDGIPDLAVANRDSATVSVLLGKGDGTFHSAQSFSAGSSPFYVSAADFNGDGHPDLAVANYLSGVVTVLLNAADWPP
jgi:hypothetical protein